MKQLKSVEEVPSNINVILRMDTDLPVSDGKIFKHGTAEELAGDEQVRNLYLGRNFELKRKDYLLKT